MLDTSTKEVISRLKKLIEEEIYLHNREHIHEQEIKQLLSVITLQILNGYNAQRNIVVPLLSIYEDNIDHVMELLLPIFLNNLEKVKKLQIEKLDLSFWDEDFDVDQLTKPFLSFVEKHMVKGQQTRLSLDVSVTIDTITGGRYLRLIHRLIAPSTVQQDLQGDMANVVIMQLWIGRNIARAINRKELFYLLASLFLDTLHFNQNYQFARDFAEECMICSYQDGMPEYGHYLSFKVFSSTSSASAAVHYAIISNILFIQKGKISDYLLKNYYWEAIKFFRNIRFIPYAEHLFKTKPLNVSYSEYELNKLFHAYYSSLFFAKDKRLPSYILDYIDKNKEGIMQTGEREVFPWLAMLFNIKKNYSVQEYDQSHLERYIDLFKRIVSPNNFIYLYNSLFGSITELGQELKKSLLNLTFTRNPSDFVNDNKVALQLSHRNIEASFETEDVEAYLLSMILQSDFSTVFKNKDTHVILPVNQSYIKKQFEKEYYTPAFIRNFVLALKGADVLWLGTDNNVMCPMYYTEGEFLFLKDKKRGLIDEYRFSKDRMKDLPLETRKSASSSFEKIYEDYQEEEEKIKQEISFFRLPIQPQKTILLIKDIELSSFPHNLVTTSDEFICNLIPVSNIMSLEWLIENQGSTLTLEPTKSIWIPIDSMDMPICMMYSKMQEDIGKFNIVLNTKILPASPLESEINIVVAHGSEKISTFPAFYLNNSEQIISIRSFDHVIGQGKVLIMFVCHSGSEKTDFFRNQTLTIVKQFLQDGYKAVIAPFWALHIDIPQFGYRNSLLIFLLVQI